MKKLFLATTFILAISITTSFAQEKKQLTTTPQKVENTTQDKTKLSTTKNDELKKESTKKAHSTCNDSSKKEGSCCDKKRACNKENASTKEKTTAEKQIAPPVKQRPSNHPALQQTFPGGEHEKKGTSEVKLEKKDLNSNAKSDKSKRAITRRDSRVAKSIDENNANTLQKNIGKK